MAISKAKAKSLAVAYSAYNEAVEKNDANSVWVWAKILRKAQKDTGVELIDNERLDGVVA